MCLRVCACRLHSSLCWGVGTLTVGYAPKECLGVRATMVRRCICLPLSVCCDVYVWEPAPAEGDFVRNFRVELCLSF